MLATPPAGRRDRRSASSTARTSAALSRRARGPRRRRRSSSSRPGDVVGRGRSPLDRRRCGSLAVTSTSAAWARRCSRFAIGYAPPGTPAAPSSTSAGEGRSCPEPALRAKGVTPCRCGWPRAFPSHPTFPPASVPRAAWRSSATTACGSPTPAPGPTRSSSRPRSRASRRRLRIGTAVMPVYTRTPSVLAAGAGSVAQLAPGRFVLGLGASSETIVRRVGRRPVRAAARRSARGDHVIRQMLAGERVTFEGKTAPHEGVPPRVAAAAAGADLPGGAHAADARARRRDRRRRDPEHDAGRSGAAHARARPHSAPSAPAAIRRGTRDRRALPD